MPISIVPESDPTQQVKRDGRVDGIMHSKIMIIDDEPTTTLMVRKHLERVGYENFVILTESTGAVETIRAEDPDVVLLDVVMPNLGGLDILARVRRQDDLAHLPVIILTASADTKTKFQALAQGATDFLAKPLDPSELVLRVRNVLGIKAFQDHLADSASELEQQVSLRTKQLLASQKNVTQGYLAGKAEIATELLHNVGNVLNSLNVSIAMLRRAANESRVPYLVKAADLLQRHRNVPDYLLADDHGKLLPDYFSELAESLAIEQTDVLQEINAMQLHLDHMTSVIAMQQKYVGVSSYSEPVSLVDLLDDAVALAGLSHHRDIEIIRDYQPVPELMVDKQKLLQVLLNLVRNADEAMSDNAPGTKRLRLSISPCPADRVRIQFTDSGEGIPADNLTKIFSHGFTTKFDGTGVGLHSCANRVKELGGAVTASSEGRGCGATFTIDLPLLNGNL